MTSRLNLWVLTVLLEIEDLRLEEVLRELCLHSIQVENRRLSKQLVDDIDLGKLEGFYEKELGQS